MNLSTRSSPRRSVAGFTLLETMVALILIGVGYTLALGAMSGSLRLTASSAERENAARLARMRLDEYTTIADALLVEEDKEEQYGGMTYSYKIEVRPVPLLAKRWEERVKSPLKLEEIGITVYWGKAGEQRYTLTTYKSSPTTPAPDAAAAPADKKPASAPTTGFRLP